MAWWFWTTRQRNSCSTPGPKSLRPNSRQDQLAQTVKKKFFSLPFLAKSSKIFAISPFSYFETSWVLLKFNIWNFVHVLQWKIWRVLTNFRKTRYVCTLNTNMFQRIPERWSKIWSVGFSRFLPMKQTLLIYWCFTNFSSSTCFSWNLIPWQICMFNETWHIWPWFWAYLSRCWDIFSQIMLWHSAMYAMNTAFDLANKMDFS